MVKTIRWIFRLIFLIVFVSLLAVGALFLWLRTSLPQTNGTMTLAGLSAEVEVLRDKHGIPHIYAKTDADAFFDRSQARAWGWQDAFRDGNGATYGS